MEANVRVRVRLPDGMPAAGASIWGVNHDAWLHAQRELRAVADPDGAYSFPTPATGQPGDRYTFRASYTDPEAREWIGEAYERLRDRRAFTIVLVEVPSASGSGTRPTLEHAPAPPERAPP